MSGRSPYVVGPWVRGERFYGRQHLLSELSSGPRSAVWVVGLRRIGKTSLLRQLERLARPRGTFLPLVWDLQGSSTLEELDESLVEALVDAEGHLESLGISVDEVAGEGGLFDRLARLRRLASRRNLPLLLLCDEVEELIGIERRDPSTVAKLRRALVSKPDVRLVVASSIALRGLGQDGAPVTSPFLSGLAPPLYVGPLQPGPAAALLRQEQLTDGDGVSLTAETVGELTKACDGHPFHLQLVGRRVYEGATSTEAVQLVARDAMVAGLVAHDMEMLSADERLLVGWAARQGPFDADQAGSALGLDPLRVKASIVLLGRLGWLHCEEGRADLRNELFRTWVREREVGPARTELAVPSAALDLLGYALVVVTPERRLVYANDLGTQLLKRRDGVGLAGERVEVLGVGDAEAVARAIAKVLRDGRRPRLVRIDRAGGMGMWAVAVQVLAGPNVTVALRFVDPSRSPGRCTAYLRVLYGLTDAECELVERLVRGSILKEAAAELDVSVHTARTHLRSVFDKTRTRRQVDLVRLALSGPSVLSDLEDD